jgi:hypothetical protein
MHWTIDMPNGDARTLEARLGGELTAADLTAFVVALASRADESRARRLLVDASGLSSTLRPSSAELRTIASTVMRDTRLRRARIGVVAPTPDAFGLCRMLVAIAGGGAGIGVFRGREPATRFLTPSIP